MNRKGQIVFFLAIILTAGFLSFWFPRFAYWLSHDGFPFVFSVIGVLGVADCGYRTIRDGAMTVKAKGSLAIGIGSLGLAGGFVIGQAFPVIGVAVIVGSLLPWAYGLMLQRPVLKGK